MAREASHLVAHMRGWEASGLIREALTKATDARLLVLQRQKLSQVVSDWRLVHPAKYFEQAI